MLRAGVQLRVRMKRTEAAVCRIAAVSTGAAT